MQQKWVQIIKKADFRHMVETFGISPIIARILANRDIVKDEDIRRYLHAGMEELYSPWLLKDMKCAVHILREKIEMREKIRIIGDYDIDGVTSTYILVTALKELGANVDTYIPDRVADGYGMHKPLIERAISDGVDTILTCDNGITAIEETAMAKNAGMTVIITDHHDVHFEMKDDEKRYLMPEADAIINPKQQGCDYPGKNICGAVVAYKLVCALYESFGLPKQRLDIFTEIIAIATIGDVMTLQGENRIIVKEGLKKLQYTDNIGLRELIKACSLEHENMKTWHIGFVIGPCINASGRIDNASRSLELLMAEDRDYAARSAGDLQSLNAARKEMTEKGKDEAIRLVKETSLKNDDVLVVYLPDCHESIAGIIAGRVREAFYKPVFILTKGEESLKGSGRSIEGYNMHEELLKCEDLLLQFGGHPMAAGLSIDEKNVDEFRQRLNRNSCLTEEDLTEKVEIDLVLPFKYINRNFIQELQILEPCGNGNPKPIFAQKDVRILSYRVLGKNKNFVKAELEDAEGYRLTATYFDNDGSFAEFLKTYEKMSLTYYPELNIYNGIESIQLKITNYRE